MSVGASDSQALPTVVTDNIGQGVLVGGGAWITTYVTTVIIAIIDGLSGNLALGREVPTWKLYGLIVYNSHFVNLVSVDIISGERESHSLFREQVIEIWPSVGQRLPQIVYRLIPIIVLIGAGYLLVRRIEFTNDPSTAAIVGSTIAIGYGVLALLGVFFFRMVQEELVTKPALIPAIVLAGIVYPVIFGGVGGYLGTKIGG